MKPKIIILLCGRTYSWWASPGGVLGTIRHMSVEKAIAKCLRRNTALRAYEGEKEEECLAKN